MARALPGREARALPGREGRSERIWNCLADASSNSSGVGTPNILVQPWQWMRLMRWRGLTTTSTLVGQKGQSALRGAAGPSPLEVDGGTPAASFDLTSLELQAATSSCCFRADDGRCQPRDAEDAHVRTRSKDAHVRTHRAGETVRQVYARWAGARPAQARLAHA